MIISKSKFSLLRCAVAMGYADGCLLPEEKEWLEQKFNKLPLTEENWQVLEKDLVKGVDINAALPEVTDPIDRDWLVKLAENLFLVDGDFASNEQVWFRKFKEMRQIPITKLAEYLQEKPFPSVSKSPSEAKMSFVDLSQDDVKGAMEKLLDGVFHNVA